MTVGDLIKELQTIPPDLIICRPGYEGGFKEVKKAVTVLLAVNINSEWYYGEHELLKNVQEKNSQTYEVMQGVILD